MKMMNLWMLVAVAALASACSKQDTEGFEGATATKTIEFVATDAGGRTIFGEPNGDNYPVLWQEGDNVRANLNFEYDTEGTKSLFVGNGSVAVTPSADQKSATFKLDLSSVTQQAPYTFYVHTNPSAWKHTYDEPNGKFRVQLPVAQTATATSCDTKAQLLFAKSETMDALPSKINLQFKHLTAYGKISLKNIGGTAKTVVLTFEKKVAQNFWYNAATGEISEGAQSTITVTTSSSDVWFAALPADLSGTKLTLKVTTAEGATFSKDITLKEGCELKSGRIAKFSVDFSDVVVPPAEDGFKIGDVYPATGTPESVIFWVADDGKSAKICNLKNEREVWMELPAGMEKYPNISGLTGSGKTGIEYTNAIRESVKNNGYVVPMITCLDALGADWYWPMASDYTEMYNNLATLNATLAGIADANQLLASHYWTSQESAVSTNPSSANYGSSLAYYFNFKNGGNSTAVKSGSKYLRAVKIVTKE